MWWIQHRMRVVLSLPPPNDNLCSVLLVKYQQKFHSPLVPHLLHLVFYLNSQILVQTHEWIIQHNVVL